MDRRDFLIMTLMGSLSFAAACSMESEERLYSQVKNPEDMVTGKARWYATTCRQCPAGCGVLAKNREGRVIKLEGNPLHPVNKGKLCIRGQSALQHIYNPDRLQKPQIKENNSWRELSFQEATRILKEKAESAAGRGANRVRMVTEIEGSSLVNLFEQCLTGWNSSKPLIYESLAYENLKKANEIVFGLKGLPSYKLDQCDFLACFGADFLETWLSPVEYARKFKAMHGYDQGRKGIFFYIGPYRSLTGANADEWLKCPPGLETAVVLGIMRRILFERSSSLVSDSMKKAMLKVSEPYTKEEVVQKTGIDVNKFDLLIERLMRAKKPLILGTGIMGRGPGDLQANIAVNLLNYLLDPNLGRIDFSRRHRIELACGLAELTALIDDLNRGKADVLLLNNVNPMYTLPPDTDLKKALNRQDLFAVSFSNFWDETAQQCDLVFPVSLPLETWGEYGGKQYLLSTLQPAMSALNKAPHLGDVFLQAAGKSESMKQYLIDQIYRNWGVSDTVGWISTLSSGGQFENKNAGQQAFAAKVTEQFRQYFEHPIQSLQDQTLFIAVPSIRFYDGREANIPWIHEIPDPLTKVAWQSTLMIHPHTAGELKIKHGDVLKLKKNTRSITAAAFETEDIMPGLLAMHLGQGHTAYGRYARGRGANALELMDRGQDPLTGAVLYTASGIKIEKIDRWHRFAHTDGSIDQHYRKIALTSTPAALSQKPEQEKHGLSMFEFPFTLPLPEGYDPHRDFYPAHKHAGYRWAMVVDLDRCIGCNACVAACYAENNVGMVGEEGVIKGREMSWLHIERYRRMDDPEKLIFLPMLCQHCDNAPCESVCPVFAPHHNKEGINNQIYNRCIGTRFCAQNCPYKVRKFNWHEWPWPGQLNLQLNPDVTVRTKGVMEKCSFCIQRIKDARDKAKNEGRMIEDGEVIPACVQTCPTNTLFFGSLLDESSRVSTLVKDRRAYQVMGYLNTKPAVIYLSKVVHEDLGTKHDQNQL